MQCPKCKAIASDGARFCLRCGSPLPARLVAKVISVTPAPSAPPTRQHNARVVAQQTPVRQQGVAQSPQAQPQQQAAARQAQSAPAAARHQAPRSAQLSGRPRQPQHAAGIQAPNVAPQPAPVRAQQPFPVTTHRAAGQGQAHPAYAVPGLAQATAAASPAGHAQRPRVAPTLTSKTPVPARSRVKRPRLLGSFFIALIAMLAIAFPLAMAVMGTTGITSGSLTQERPALTESAPGETSSPEASPAPGQPNFYTPRVAPFSASDLSPEWNASPGRFWYSRLTSRQQTIYDAFYTALASGQLECHIDIDSFDTDFNTASRAVYLDNPELFWYKDSFNYTYWDEPGHGMNLTLDSYYDISGVPEYQSRIEQRIEEFLVTVPPGASSYEKAQLAYVWVSNQSVYEHCDHDQIITSVLLEGQSVCAGYARTYQALLERMGIPCATLHGYNDENPEEGHLWNIVCLDGVTGYVDVTWGDMDDGSVDPQYFFFGDELLGQIGHHIDPEDQPKVPACPLAREGL